MKKTIVLGVSTLVLTMGMVTAQHLRSMRPGKSDGASAGVTIPAMKSCAMVKLAPGQKRQVNARLKSRHGFPVKEDGDVQLPFVEDFADGLGGFTPVDANGDGVTWAPSSGMVRTNAKDGAGDDWLMSPGLPLEEGRNYQLSFTLKAWSSTYNEKIEVKCGQGLTVEDMTTQILDSRYVKDYTNSTTTPVTVTLEFTAPATGLFNIGIRSFGGDAYGTGDARYYNYVDDFKLDALALPVAPAKIEDLTVTPGAMGAISSEISFTVPDKAVDGSLIDAIEKVELSRGGQIINTFDEVMPAQYISFTDPAPTQGLNTYSVVAYSGSGKGESAEATVFVGTDTPGNVKVSAYDDSSSSLKATWDPVTEGINGGYVDQTTLSYIIGEYVEPENWWEDVTVNTIGETSQGITSYDFGINPDEGEQKFVEYIIAAKNAAATGEYAYISPTSLKVIGAPYQLPFDETFAKARMQDRFWIMQLEDPYTSNGFYITAKESYDSEAGSGCISWTPIYDDESAMLITGKISISEAANPVVFAAIKGAAGSTAKVQIAIQKVDGVIETLHTTDFAADGAGEWIPLQLPVARFKDNKYVHFIFSMLANKNDGQIFIDDIHVIDLVERNPSVDFEAPKSVVAGRKAVINVNVVNRGSLPMGDFSLLVKGGESVLFDETIEAGLPTLGSVTVPVEFVPSVFSEPGQLPLTVEVTSEGVRASAQGVIELLEAPDFSVSDLAASDDEGGVMLTWTHKDIIPQDNEESFETFAHGSISGLDSWLLVDGDGGLAGGMTGYTLPHDDEAYSFMVLDPSEVNLGDDSAFAPHSGNKYLIASYVYADDSYVDCDDWIISPELPGNAQTISFWINSYDGDEAYEVLYSTTGTDTGDFVSILDGTVGTEWTEVTADIPMGTKYFAIHRVTDGPTAFYMMIDDISYSTGVNIDHYNVYADREYVGQTKENLFVVPCVDNDLHEYSVTSVTPDGRESAPATVYAKSGVETAVADGSLLYDVYTVTGIQLKSNARSLDGLLPGIYIVNGRKIVIK